MAKIKSSNEVVVDGRIVEQESAPAMPVKQGTVLPSLIGASPEILAQMNEVRENFESIENFRLPRAKMTSEGFELTEGETLIKELEGVIIHSKKTNAYYSKTYIPGEVAAPDCYSLDGVTPAQNMKDEKGMPKKPVHPTCKGCPMAEYGTNQMKSGKACRNLKPLFMLLGDNTIMPMQVTVTPVNLKAANQYLIDLTMRGMAYRKVKTKIIAFKENAKDTYMKLRFTMGKRLDEQEQKNVEFLKNQWLPVMNNQMIDQNEVDSMQTQSVETSNEY